MWLFIPGAFFSAVQHKDDPNKIMVRTRAKLHAQRLVQMLPPVERPELVETPPPADYRWRITLTRAQWVFVVAKAAAEVTYLNFKNEAHRMEHPQGYMSALHRIWGDLLSFQDTQHQDTRYARWGVTSSQSYFSRKPQPSKSNGKGRRQTFLEEEVFSTSDWLRGLDPTDEDLYEMEEEEEVEEMDGIRLGDRVALKGDTDFVDGEVQALYPERHTAHVLWSLRSSSGTSYEAEDISIRDLEVLRRESQEEIEEIECSESDLEIIAETDDGSWPPPKLGGFLRGR